MNILIINGSPAGDNSITLQTVLYIEKKFPKHEYTLINAAQKIRALEKDFSEAGEALAQAELIVFCYPVYTFLVPAQLHRFIELMKESGINLEGKYAAQITTSKHFYDVTAFEFIKQNCEDLKLRYMSGLSADMEDLLHKKGQKEAVSFFHHLLWSVKKDSCSWKIDNKADGSGKRIVIVADLEENNIALQGMISSFCEVSSYSCSIVNLRDFQFAGGCLGCFHCASDGKCFYKDGFDTFLRENIQTADATVYAFTIRDHSMGHRFKLYDDRQFCNGHRTVTMGKPVGYIVDGRLGDEPNLKMLIESRAQVGGNYLAGIAGNEADADRSINMLAAELQYAVERDYQQPANFYGVGGMKIFRDLIYQMQGLMKEDHRFYKEHGFYDFPQKRKGTIAGMYLVGALMNSPKLSKKIGGNMTKGMLMPYKKILEKSDRKNRS